jgi:phosphatidylglycerol:prolipoprotein diacylglycerol transferase
MYPILGFINDTPILSYYVFNSIGIIAGFIVLFLSMKNFDPSKRNRTLLFAALIFIPFILGARLGNMLEDFLFHTPECVTKNILIGPSSIWWGLAVSNLCAIPIARALKVNLWETGDLFALCIAMGGIFARFACLLNGCCFGTPAPADFPFAVYYPYGSYAYSIFGGAPVYPAQLFESVAWFFIFMALFLRNRAKAFHGELIILLGFLYAIARFIIEFFRYHEKPGFPSSAQVLSLIILAASALVWILKKRGVIR